MSEWTDVYAHFTKEPATNKVSFLCDRKPDQDLPGSSQEQTLSGSLTKKGVEFRGGPRGQPGGNVVGEGSGVAAQGLHQGNVA